MKSSTRIINCRGLPATENFSLVGGKARSISSAIEKGKFVPLRASCQLDKQVPAVQAETPGVPQNIRSRFPVS